MTTVQPSRPRPITRTAEFPLEAASVAAVRRTLAADLLAAQVGQADSADVLVVLSELLGNSVRHARPLNGGSFRVMWRIRPREVEVAVADGGAVTQPRAERPPFAALSGRGLGIVDALAESWGVEGAGTTSQLVWAVVLRTEHA